MAENDIDASIDLEPDEGAPVLDGPGNQDNNEAETEDEASLEASAEDEDDGTTEQSEPDEELIDFEEGGKKYQVPKALKDHLLRQSDYSRKTQEVAEARKAIEAERDEVTRWRETEDAAKRSLAQLADVDHKLKNFAQGANGQMVSADQIDWDAWFNANPQQARDASTRLNILNQQKTNLAKSVDEAKAHYESETKRRTAERLRATREYAEKELPNWTPERHDAIIQMVDGQGISGAAARAIIESMEPGLYNILDLALDGSRSRDETAKRKAGQAPPSNVTQLKTLGRRSSAGAVKSPDKMSMDEYAAWRNGQNAKSA